MTGTLIHYIRDFGAVGNNSHDDTAAIQSAINAAQLDGGHVFGLGGTCRITAPLVISSPIKFIGPGSSSFHIAPSRNIDAIQISTPDKVGIEDLGIVYFEPGALGTAGIRVTSPAGENSGSTFRNLFISQASIGIDAVKASLWTVDNCYFNFNVFRGLSVRNDNSVDSGDSNVINSLFTGSGAVTHLYQASSGGLRVLNNKFLGGAVQLWLDLAHGVVTSVLLINGNSMENSTVAAIRLNRQSVSGSFQNLMINNNEISPAAGFGICVPSDVASGWLLLLGITGNIIVAQPGVTAVAVDSVNGVAYTGNLLEGLSPTSRRAVFGSGALNVTIGPNQYIGTWGANAISSMATTTIEPF